MSCILDNTIHGRIDQVILLRSVFENPLRSNWQNNIALLHVYVYICENDIFLSQVNQVLELDKKSVCAARYNALDKWAGQLQSLHTAIVNKMS